jgi:hypothetical protein
MSKAATLVTARCYVDASGADYTVAVAGQPDRMVCRAHLADVIVHLLVAHPAADVHTRLIDLEL